jgi:hypothetical protein
MINLIYKFLRLFNDVKAVKNGRIIKRIGRRVSGKASGRIFGRWFR